MSCARDGKEPALIADFDRVMRGLGPFAGSEVFAVALSGGSDSLFLALQMVRWCRQHHFSFLTVTVDHRLRQESASEAQWCQRQMSRYGIPHDTLIWEQGGEEPTTQVTQEHARSARYALLDDWCRKKGVTYLCLGHHQDDQLETVMMRAKKKSGVLGLAGMSVVVQRPFGFLIRPLLNTPKETLLQSLKAHEQEWLDDPSNRAPYVLRTRYRRAVAGLSSAQRSALSTNTRLLGQSRHRLERATQHYLSTQLRVSPTGTMTLPNDRLSRDTRGAVFALAFRQCLAVLSGSDYLPSLEHCRAFLAPFLQSANIKKGNFRKSLSNCVIWQTGQGDVIGDVTLARENRSLPVIDLAQQAEAGWRRWDARYEFWCHLPSLLSWLREQGQSLDAELTPTLRSAGKKFAFASDAFARQSLPALWMGGQCLAVVTGGQDAAAQQEDSLPFFCPKTGTQLPHSVLATRWRPKKSISQHPFTVA